MQLKFLRTKFERAVYTTFAVYGPVSMEIVSKQVWTREEFKTSRNDGSRRVFTRAKSTRFVPPFERIRNRFYFRVLMHLIKFFSSKKIKKC